MQFNSVHTKYIRDKMQIRVYYEDTDAGGIVYHTNYIKYCERARSEIFFEHGMMPGVGNLSGFVVRDISARFLSPSMLGDILNVTTEILKLKNSSMILLQEIFKDEIKIFSMEVVLVYMANGTIERIPLDFRTLFDSID